MIDEWSLLISKFKLEGARKRFEEICVSLFHKVQNKSEVIAIRPNPGDNGIDFFLLDSNANKVVYQCKFFPDKIDANRWNQIDRSFNEVTRKELLSEWNLCIPLILSNKEANEWQKWKLKKNKEHKGLKINLITGDVLIDLSKNHGIYNLLFNYEDNVESIVTSDEFITEINEKQKGFLGRMKEKRAIRKFVKEKNRGFLFVYGEPGIGKSAFMAKMYNEIYSSTLIGNNQIIPYIIRRGTESAKLSVFLLYMNIEVEKVLQTNIPIRQDFKYLSGDLHRRFIQARSKSKKLVVLIDALDEGLEGGIINEFSKNVYDNVIFLIFSRNIDEVDTLFLNVSYAEKDLINLEGLDKSSLAEIVSKIVKKHNIPKKLTQAIIKNSNGNPKYLELLELSITKGSLNLSNESDVPLCTPVFHDFYNPLLKKYAKDKENGNNILNAIYTFAVAKDYLTVQHLKELLDLEIADIKKIIFVLREILHIKTNQLGYQEQYTIHHASLREYLIECEREAINEKKHLFVEFCRRWKTLYKYSDGTSVNYVQLYPLNYYAMHLADVYKVNESYKSELFTLTEDIGFIEKQYCLTKKYNAGFELCKIAMDIAVLEKEANMITNIAINAARIHTYDNNSVKQIKEIIKSNDINNIDVALERLDNADQRNHSKLYMILLNNLLHEKHEKFVQVSIDSVISHLEKNLVGVYLQVPFGYAYNLILKMKELNLNYSKLLYKINLSDFYVYDLNFSSFLKTINELNNHHVGLLSEMIQMMLENRDDSDFQAETHGKFIAIKQLCIKFLENGYYKEALELLEMSYHKNKKQNTEIYRIVAQIFVKMGDFDNALNYLQKIDVLNEKIYVFLSIAEKYYELNNHVLGFQNISIALQLFAKAKENRDKLLLAFSILKFLFKVGLDKVGFDFMKSIQDFESFKHDYDKITLLRIFQHAKNIEPNEKYRMYIEMFKSIRGNDYGLDLKKDDLLKEISIEFALLGEIKLINNMLGHFDYPYNKYSVLIEIAEILFYGSQKMDSELIVVELWQHVCESKKDSNYTISLLLKMLPILLLLEERDKAKCCLKNAFEYCDYNASLGSPFYKLYSLIPVMEKLNEMGEINVLEYLYDYTQLTINENIDYGSLCTTDAVKIAKMMFLINKHEIALSAIEKGVENDICGYDIEHYIKLFRELNLMQYSNVLLDFYKHKIQETDYFNNIINILGKLGLLNEATQLIENSLSTSCKLLLNKKGNELSSIIEKYNHQEEKQNFINDKDFANIFDIDFSKNLRDAFEKKNYELVSVNMANKGNSQLAFEYAEQVEASKRFDVFCQIATSLFEVGQQNNANKALLKAENFIDTNIKENNTRLEAQMRILSIKAIEDNSITDYIENAVFKWGIKAKYFAIQSVSKELFFRKRHNESLQMIEMIEDVESYNDILNEISIESYSLLKDPNTAIKYATKINNERVKLSNLIDIAQTLSDQRKLKEALNIFEQINDELASTDLIGYIIRNISSDEIPFFFNYIYQKLKTKEAIIEAQNSLILRIAESLKDIETYIPMILPKVILNQESLSYALFDFAIFSKSSMKYSKEYETIKQVIEFSDYEYFA